MTPHRRRERPLVHQARVRPRRNRVLLRRGGGAPAWADDDHEGALFESTNFGRDFECVPYPAEPDEVIETWAAYDGDVVCGSGLFDVPDRRDDVEVGSRAGTATASTARSAGARRTAAESRRSRRTSPPTTESDLHCGPSDNA